MLIEHFLHSAFHVPLGHKKTTVTRDNDFCQQANVVIFTRRMHLNEDWSSGMQLITTRVYFVLQQCFDVTGFDVDIDI